MLFTWYLVVTFESCESCTYSKGQMGWQSEHLSYGGQDLPDCRISYICKCMEHDLKYSPMLPWHGRILSYFPIKSCFGFGFWACSCEPDLVPGRCGPAECVGLQLIDVNTKVIGSSSHLSCQLSNACPRVGHLIPSAATHGRLAMDIPWQPKILPENSPRNKHRPQDSSLVIETTVEPNLTCRPLL